MNAGSKPTAVLDWLGALSDLVRVRTLRLLEAEELSVGELARALQLPQSTVSRHLKVLHEIGWVVKRAEGTASLYSLNASTLPDAAGQLWALTSSNVGSNPSFDQDDARLAEVLAERRSDSRAFFGRIGGEWDVRRRELFGRPFTSQAMLSLLDPNWVVADLGCGTGNAAEMIAPAVARVVAVDREMAMLDAARKRLAEFDNIEFRKGDLVQLPLDDASVDAAMIFLVLHHIEEPEVVLREVARILKPGGRILIVDMVLHDREAYRHSMGHMHLGFSEDAVMSWFASVGLQNGNYCRLRPDTGAMGPGLFVAAASAVLSAP